MTQKLIVSFNYLLLDELPLLHKLQTTRRPDLYDQSWNCFLCNEDKETWDHIWQCPVLKPRLTSLCSCTKIAFEDWVKENTKLQFTHFSTQWNNLSVWTYSDSSFYGFTFDLLIKGLIPSELTKELSKYLCKKDIPEVVNLVVSKAIDIFHEDIWAYRCQLFAEKEHTLGIDQSSKTTPSSRSTRQSPFLSFRRLNTSPNRWMTWISQSSVQRKPWTDFRIYINS